MVGSGEQQEVEKRCKKLCPKERDCDGDRRKYIDRDREIERREKSNG